MPTEDLLIPGIGAAGEVFGAISQGTQNRANRRYNDKVMWRQRMWALEDWNRQNEYNSPAAQMERLKAAGLNPNLVYGHGATAMSTQQPRSAQGGGPEGKAPRLDMSGPAMMYLTQMMQQKEMQLKDAQIATGWNDAALRAAQTLQALQGYEGSKFDLGQRQKLADTVIATAQEQLQGLRLGNIKTATETEKLENDIQMALERNERENLMNASNLREAIERILTSRAVRARIDWEIPHIMEQTMLNEIDRKLKEEDLKLKKQGIQPGDNIWWRKVTDYILEMKERAKLQPGGRFSK